MFMGIRLLLARGSSLKLPILPRSFEGKTAELKDLAKIRVSPITFSGFPLSL
jgi:hypothetical protein